MQKSLDARLQRLESAVATLPAVPQTTTDDDALEFVRRSLRERMVIFVGDRWAVNPDSSVTITDDWSWLADLCNDYSALIIPLTADDVDAALRELDAGSWFWQYDETGSGRMVDGHPWPVWPGWDRASYGASCKLAGVVRSAATVYHEQTGDGIPQNLDDLRQWLTELREGVAIQWNDSQKEVTQ